jgi:ribosomal protein S18 acetylase RimI-like enzyme
VPTEDPATRFRIERLGRAHDREAFSCGVSVLDEYIRRYASQDVRRGATAVFVATPDSTTIAGYYTLSQYSIELDQVPEDMQKRLPRYHHLPATLLGRLARSSRFQGQGLGEYLLMHALQQSLHTTKAVASAAVVVDSKDERSAAFYRRYGFLDLPKTPSRLFLPMKTIEELFS